MQELPVNTDIILQALGSAALMTCWMQSSTIGGILLALGALRKKWKRSFYTLISASTVTGFLSFLHVYQLTYATDKVGTNSLSKLILPFSLFAVFVFAATVTAVVLSIMQKENGNKFPSGPYTKFWLLLPILFCAVHFRIAFFVTQKQAHEFVTESANEIRCLYKNPRNIDQKPRS